MDCGVEGGVVAEVGAASGEDGAEGGGVGGVGRGGWGEGGAGDGAGAAVDDDAGCGHSWGRAIEGEVLRGDEVDEQGDVAGAAILARCTRREGG